MRSSYKDSLRSYFESPWRVEHVHVINCNNLILWRIITILRDVLSRDAEVTCGRYANKIFSFPRQIKAEYYFHRDFRTGMRRIFIEFCYQVNAKLIDKFINNRKRRIRDSLLRYVCPPIWLGQYKIEERAIDAEWILRGLYKCCHASQREISFGNCNSIA